MEPATTIEFLQKRWPNRRKFTLTSDKLIVESKTLSKNIKFETKLDKLGLNLHYESDNTIPGKIFIGTGTVMIGVMTIAHFASNSIDTRALILNYCVWGIFILMGYFKQHQNDLFLTGGETKIAFYQNIPDEKTVTDFINEIRSRVKIYLKEKYIYFDSATTEYDFYHRISWLRDNEIISQTEFIEYKAIFDMNRQS